MKQWVLSLACLYLLYPSVAPTETASSYELPFRFSSGYLIQVDGRIADQAHLKFILDTGASISIIDRRIAQKLKLDVHPAESFNFDRKLQWETANLPEVQFGPVRAASVAVLVGDLANYSEFARKADAIIGMDLLQLNNFTVDFDAGHLVFARDVPGTYLAGGDPMSRCLTVELQVQDRPVHLIVDTGLQGMVLYEERLRKSVPGLRTAGSIKNATMGRQLPAKQATLPDVVIGNRNREIAVVLLPSPAAEMLPGIDGIVGIAALQAHRVHFDFSAKILTWE